MEYPKPIPANDPPPAGVHVLTDSTPHGGWQGQYLPDDEKGGYQPDAWQLVGVDDPISGVEVTQWQPMPPAAKSR